MDSTCSVCSKGKKTSAPSVWCRDCDDLLCQPCTEQHKHQKDTRNHSTIPYQDYQKLPTFILNVKPYCKDHNKKYTEFCRNHDAPLCTTCRKRHHKKCKDIPKIMDIIHKVKDSVLFQDTMLEIKTKCGTLKQIAVDKNKNLQKLHITSMEMKAGIEEKIETLIKHLTKLKDKTLSEMDAVHNKLTNDIYSTLKTVQSKEKELHDILDQKEDILKYASNYQTFIGIKEMETIVNEVDIYLNELANDQKLLEYDLKFQANENIEGIISGIQSLGDIQVTKSPLAVSIQKTGARYFEAVKEIQTPGHNGMQLQLQQTINLKSSHDYYGCCILPSGLIVIADHGNNDGNDSKIIIHKSDGSIRSIIKFNKSDGVKGVTPVDDHHVAVSHPWSEAISIINVDNDQIVRKLKIREIVGGLCCRGRELLCCAESAGLVRVNIDSQEVEMVREDESVGYDSHVQVGNSLICYTCPDTHKVTALDSQYNVIFTYKGKDNFVFTYQDITGLSNPLGVTIDDHNNIYVTGQDSDNLVMISPDGKSCHQILGKDDGLSGPTDVHYDSRTKNLVVVNYNGPAFIYSVQ